MTGVQTCALPICEIIESGTHQELLIKNGLYAQMWHQYCQSVEWKVGEQE